MELIMENHGDVRQKKLKQRGQTKIVEQDHKLLQMWDVVHVKNFLIIMELIMEDHGDVRQKKLKRCGQTKIVEQDHKLPQIWDVHVKNFLIVMELIMEDHGDVRQKKFKRCGQTKIVEQDHKLLQMLDVQTKLVDLNVRSEAEVGAEDATESELGYGESQLVGGSLHKMLLVVLVLMSCVLGFYIGQRKLREKSKYNLLSDAEEISMVSYQTQQE